MPARRNAPRSRAAIADPDTLELVTGLKRDLAAAGTPERASSEKRYLKSNLQFLGVTVPAIRRIAKGFHTQHRDLGRAQLVALVEAMWATDIHELHMAAIELLDMCSGLLLPEDVPQIEHMLRTSYTWAYVDSLAATVVGRLVERHSELKQTLDRWAVDDDFWVRRSAMLALLVLLRGGEGDWPRFTRYADSMLEEKEFFIRKAVGWVLRDTSKKRPGLVLAYLTSPAKRGGPPRAALMAGLTYREATRQLPPQMQARAAAARETEA